MNNPPTPSRRPRQRVLIIDDHEFMRLSLAELLSREGFVVGAVASAEEALAALTEQEYGIVVTDLMMPGMDGIELCARLRADPAHAGLRIVLFTSHATPDVEARAIAAGANGIVGKNDPAQVLLASLRTKSND
jgi:CheY-like chemotaxis protein